MKNIINLSEHKIKKNVQRNHNPENIMLCFSEKQLVNMLNSLSKHQGETLADFICNNRNFFYVGYLDREKNMINPTL